MKLKDGLLALTVAAALGTSGAFAQGPYQPNGGPPEAPHDEGGKALSPLADEKQTATVQPSSEEDSASMEQSASAGASISDDQRSRAGEPLSSSSASTLSQAQSDVPPPVDSETVRNIQQALSDQGHQVQVDGIWGEETHQAVMEFQREQNLEASGQLDGETFAALQLTEGTQTASAGAQEEPPQQTASAAEQQPATPPPPESSAQPGPSQ